MDSDSSESDSDDAKNNYQQFNATQTEKVIDCVNEILKIITKGVNIGVKKGRKNIKKETKKTKPKNAFVDYNMHIGKLCEAISGIASTLVSSSSRYVESSPRSNIETNPGTSTHRAENAVAGTSGSFSKPVRDITKKQNNTTESVTSLNTELLISASNKSTTTNSDTLKSDTKAQITPESVVKAVSAIQGTCMEADQAPTIPESVCNTIRNVISLVLDSSKSSAKTTESHPLSISKNSSSHGVESSSQNLYAKEVTGTPASISNAAVSETSRNSETICETSKSLTLTTPKPLKKHIEHCDRLDKPVETHSKTYNGTAGSCIQAAAGIPETNDIKTVSAPNNSEPNSSTVSLPKTTIITPMQVNGNVSETSSRKRNKSLKETPQLSVSVRPIPNTEASNNTYTSNFEASTEFARDFFETKNSNVSRKLTDTEVSEISSRSDGVQSGTETVHDTTSSLNTKPGTLKSNSSVFEFGTSRSKTFDATSGRRDDNVLHAESSNMVIYAEPKSITLRQDEINNNDDTVRKTKVDLKTNANISNNNEPKQAKVDRTCNICLKEINDIDLGKHYKVKHGIHHEIKHNTKNYEFKIQDLQKRLLDTSNINQTTNVEQDKITVKSNKRTADRSLSVPVEGSKHTVINVDSEEVEIPAEKRKRAAIRLDSAPSERVHQPMITAPKSETNQNIVVDICVVDLTDDNSFAKSKLSTDIIWRPKPTDDDQKLNTIDTIDIDTSLYELPDEIKTEHAEAILLENVKVEQAGNHQLDSDVEVFNNIYPTLSIKNNLADKKNQQSTNQIIQKHNDTEAIFPDTSSIVIETVPKSSKSLRKISEASAGTVIKHTEGIGHILTNHLTKVLGSEVSVSCSSMGTIGNSAKLGTRVDAKHPLKCHLNESAITSSQHVTQNKERIAQQDSLKKRTDKPARKLPYEKPNKTLSNGNKSSSGIITTKASVKEPKVPKQNPTNTTAQRTQKSNETNSVKNYNSEASNTTKINSNNVPTETCLQVKPKRHLLTNKNSTSLITKQKTHKTKQLDSVQQNSYMNYYEVITDVVIGNDIKTVSAPNNSVSNSSTMSLPKSTTITPIQANPNANEPETARKHTKSLKETPQLSISLQPTSNTEHSKNTHTSIFKEPTLQKQPTNQINQKQNEAKAIVPDTSTTGIATVPKSSISTTEDSESPGNNSKVSSGTDIKRTQAMRRISNNPTNILGSGISVSRSSMGTAGYNTNFGTSRSPIDAIEPLKCHLKESAGTLAQRDSLKKRIDKQKHARKSPYEKPHKTLSNSNKGSSGIITNKTSVKERKVPQQDPITTTAQPKQKPNETNSVKNNSSEASNINSGIVPSEALHEAKQMQPILINPNSTTGKSKQPLLDKFYSILSSIPSELSLNNASSKLNSVPQNTSKCASNSASVLPANDRLQTNNSGLPVTKSNQQRPVSPTSRARDILQSNGVVLTSVTSTHSKQSTPKQNVNKAAKTNKPHHQNISNPSQKNIGQRSGAQSNTNKTHGADIPPLTQRRSPLSSNTAIRDSNTSPCNTNGRISDMREPYRQKYSWHTPVEPETERQLRTNAENVSHNVNLSQSNPDNTRQALRNTINQRQVNDRRMANDNQIRRSSDSEVGRQNRLILKSQSTLIDNQKPTWHTPVREPWN